MPLKLMYITNDPDVARVAEDAGVDRILVDMEYIGKSLRQGGMDTVQSHHTVSDVRAIRAAIREAEFIVRVNPIHDATAEYGSSEQEINEVITAGAGIVMLPYFKTASEVERFLKIVGGRAKTMLLLETKEAVECLTNILTLPGIDFIHIGLNDLSLSYGMKFMFELLADGTVEKLISRIREAGIAYGFGGIASVDKGDVPGAYIIREHYRLGSSCAILSRSFCNCQKIGDLDKIRRVFKEGMAAIRSLEAECAAADDTYFEENHRVLIEKVNAVSERFKA